MSSALLTSTIQLGGMMKRVHIRVTRLGTPDVPAGTLGQLKEAGTVHNPSNDIQHAVFDGGWKLCAHIPDETTKDSRQLPAALDDLDDAEHSTQTKGIVVIKKTILCAAVIGASVVLTSSAVAQANPATPLTVIESSAAQLCGAINDNPTEGGVIDGMNSLDNRGLDQTDGALVLITAIHHVCPQHEALMMGIMGSAAAQELCSKPA